MTEAVAEAKVKFCSKDYDIETGEYSFAFGDGETISGNINDFPEEVRTELMYHGWMQKGGDSYAGAGGDYTVAKASLRKVIDQLVSGDWTAKRESGGGKPRVTELVEALHRKTGRGIEELTTLVASLDDEMKKKFRSAVQAEIVAIRAEKAAARAAKLAEKAQTPEAREVLAQLGL